MSCSIRWFAPAAMLILFGCGGGGSGDGGVVGPSPTPLVASFAADQAAPTAGQAAMIEGSKTGDTVTVRVTVTGVNGIYSAGFEVLFDPANVAYVNYSSGSLFEQGGHTPNYIVNAPSAGRLVVGISRVGSVSTVNAGATTPMINLTFRVRNVGSHRLDFDNARLLDGAVPAQTIPNVTWFGGAAQGS